jgi:hypothetical protein
MWPKREVVKLECCGSKVGCDGLSEVADRLDLGVENGEDCRVKSHDKVHKVSYRPIAGGMWVYHVEIVVFPAPPILRFFPPKPSLRLDTEAIRSLRQQLFLSSLFPQTFPNFCSFVVL